jgi:hypothetical protein
MQGIVWWLFTWWLSGLGAGTPLAGGGDAVTESCDELGNCGEIRPGFDPHG